MPFEFIAVQVHQRCPLYFGSPEEVDKVLSFLAWSVDNIIMQIVIFPLIAVFGRILRLCLILFCKLALEAMTHLLSCSQWMQNRDRQLDENVRAFLCNWIEQSSIVPQIW